MTVVERDAAPPPADPDDALTGWTRPGVPQWGNGHAFHGLGRRVLRERVPDVLISLAANGVGERRFDTGLAQRKPHDDELVALQSRRPVFEWVLRRAVEAEPGVRVVTGRSATQVRRDSRGVTGLMLDDGAVVDAVWIIDASGQRRLDRLWREAGVPEPTVHQQPAPTFYYARHFRQKPNFSLPNGEFHFGPSGDLGFLRYSVLKEDRDGFVVTLNTRAAERDIRALRDDRSWMAVADAIPGLSPWVQPEVASPISGVFVHAGRGNVLVEHDIDRILPGLVVVGDALCQTNPTQGWGVSLALHGAALIADAVPNATGNERSSVTKGLARTLLATVRPFFEAACAEDRERLRQAAGEVVDVTDPNSALFCRSVAYRVADCDDELYRAVQRRIHLIDPPGLLPGDSRLMAKACELWASQPPQEPPARPTRDQIANIIRTNVQIHPAPTLAQRTEGIHHE